MRLLSLLFVIACVFPSCKKDADAPAGTDGTTTELPADATPVDAAVASTPTDVTLATDVTPVK